MSIKDAKEFYHLALKKESVREELKDAWKDIQAIAAKHDLHFTLGEYYDFLHDHTGMTKVGKSGEIDDPDTCITVAVSEAPGR